MFDKFIHKWLRVPYALKVYTVKSATKPVATLLFIHGIGSSSASWDKVVQRLPDNVHVLRVDLLGFGQSPKPSWAKYDTETQARSVLATLMKLRLRKKVIIVGHSLGALVAVSVVKRYPLIVRSLILCSPPFYKPDEIKKRRIPTNDQLLKDLYRLVRRHPDNFVQIALLAHKLGLLAKGFYISAETVAPYMAALEASIINQTSFQEAESLKQPITIMHGSLDPVVIKRNLKSLSMKKNVKLVTVLAGHEIRGEYVPAVVREIKARIPRNSSESV